MACSCSRRQAGQNLAKGPGDRRLDAAFVCGDQFTSVIFGGRLGPHVENGGVDHKEEREDDEGEEEEELDTGSSTRTAGGGESGAMMGARGFHGVLMRG